MAVSVTKKWKCLHFAVGFPLIALFACALTILAIAAGLPSREELLSPWMAVALLNSYINLLVIAVWMIYKEYSWIKALLWIVCLIGFGSITTGIYILWQFFKLSPSQESSENPTYYALSRQKVTKEGMEEKHVLSVAVARALFGVLGCLMLATLIYTIVIDGSPFRLKLLTPWIVITLLHSYLIFGMLSVWIFFKQSNPFAVFAWMLLLLCFGSIGTCTYIVFQLLHLPAKDSAFLILSRSSNMS